MSYLLKEGNHKLHKSIGIWNLPRTSCIGKGICDKYCYGKQFETMTQVKYAREYRDRIAKCDNFVSIITSEISFKKYKKVRIHEVGDFFNNTYLNNWKSIAKECKGTIFLAYTKSLNLDLWSNLPKNMILFQSYGGKWDYMIDEDKNTARVIININDKKDKEYLCPYGQSNFTKCGLSCTYCYSNNIKHVAFLLHNKKKRK